MESSLLHRPLPPGQTQALPSIASLTNNLPPSDQNSTRAGQQSDLRDSGSWSASQSKREYSSQLSPARLSHASHVSHVSHTRPTSLLTAALDSSTVSNQNGALHVKTLLNPQDSPSRHSVPDTPSSRFSYSHQVGSSLHYSVVSNVASPMRCRPSTSHMTTGRVSTQVRTLTPGAAV
jgi:hypothetical protein